VKEPFAQKSMQTGMYARKETSLSPNPESTSQRGKELSPRMSIQKPTAPIVPREVEKLGKREILKN